MGFRYVEIKDTKNGTDTDALSFNRKLLSDGVKGVDCSYVGECSAGERIDYTQFAPWGCYLSSVERYTNGAKNFFVKNKEDEIVGYIIVRPFTA